jgi:hypothetical protein
MNADPESTPSLLASIGLGGIMGEGAMFGPSYLWQARMNKNAEQVALKQLEDIGWTLAALNTKLGGPTPEQPEYLAPPMGAVWQRHAAYLKKLVEEVAWRAGEPLPRPKVTA